MRTLTVVCPVYNEEEVIAAFHAELRRVLDTVADRWAATVLFVVDRGTDRTLDVLRGIAAADPSVRVLALSARFGHQMSLARRPRPLRRRRGGDDGLRPAAPALAHPGAARGLRARPRHRLHGAGGQPRRPRPQARQLALVLPPHQLDLRHPDQRERGRLPPRLPPRRRGLPEADPGAEPVPARALRLGGLPEPRRPVQGGTAPGRAAPSTRCAAWCASASTGSSPSARRPCRRPCTSASPSAPSASSTRSSPSSSSCSTAPSPRAGPRSSS